MPWLVPCSEGEYYRRTHPCCEGARPRTVWEAVLAEKFDLSVLIEEYRDEARQQLDRLDAALLAIEADGALSAGERQDLLRTLHTLKGNSGMLGLSAVVDHVHAVETLFKAPPPEWPQATVDRLFESAAALRRAVERTGTDGQEEAFERLRSIDLADERPADAPAGARAEDPTAGAAELPSGDAEGGEEKEEEDEDEEEAPSGAAAVGAALSTGDLLRVPFEKLDALLNRVGELLSVVDAVDDLLDQRREGLEASGVWKPLTERVEQLYVVQDALRHATMDLRLVPIGRVFSRFPTLARDLAREQGKQVRVVLAGEDVQLDKSTIDALSEPLLHLVRNAVDHGIGTPEERRAQGKPETGTIWLSASQRGDRVRVTVEDDGSGLDREAILARARETGVVGPNAEPEPAEIDRLIFASGFSTRREATTVSGRGVGLDVVRRSVTRLRGALTVQAREEGGTRFVLRLPLTLAIVPSVLFQAAGETVAIPAAEVEETLRKVAPERAGGTEVIRHRGELVPVARPERFFRWRDVGDGGPPQRGAPFALVLRHDARAAAVITPRLLDQRNLVIRGLPAYLGPQPGVSGASVLPDGRVALLLDAGGILDLNLNSEQREDRGD